MDSFTTRYSHRLNEEIEALATRKTTMLVTTRAVDFADYSARVGYIEGLNMARQLMQKIDAEMSRTDDHEDRAPMHSRRYEE
jgi:hypothetical protein